ncbi:hypothetical protein [uncultured Flavobacterium sp.]|uniref:hypothetical protein n=1 Tax=uncultured Flavobacterium sp. TaxID=165435 RepID=UPI0025D364B8|nr:hypothetical protein [uncultured Flavobacterium sp.]
MIKTSHIKFAILLPITVFSQKNTIVPKSGTIVFVSKNIVTDEKLYEESFNNFKAYIISAYAEGIIKVNSLTGSRYPYDSGTLEIDFNVFYPLNDKTRTYKYFQEFNGSSIYHYKTLNDDMLNKIQIDINTGSTDDVFRDFEYYSHDLITDIKEFPKEIKTINGYKCFKVIYVLKKGVSPAFDDFTTGHVDYRELWVTDKIKCAYHPVISDKLILEKYYPLEINEYFNVLKGYVKKYELIKLEIE